MSTSGNSKNCVNAAEVAKCIGVKVLSLTGAKESKLLNISDCTVRVPENETFMIQEYHLPIYHYLCAATEKAFFGK
jgi:D-sedoheptulose 7-phosphate isomerase